MTHSTSLKQDHHKKQPSRSAPPSPTPQSIASQLMTIVLQDNSDDISTTTPSATLEARLATPLLIRQLYRLLPPPSAKQLPHVYRTSERSYFDKPNGYTQSISIVTPSLVSRHIPPLFNTSRVYRITYPSEIKRNLINHYEDAGWTITSVSSYNVTAKRLEQHPDCPNVAVLFTVTRERATYRYYLIRDPDTTTDTQEAD